MDTVGKHILCEMSDISADILNDVELVRRTLLAAADYAGATVVSDSFNKFEPQGVSGVVVISESHLSIHTWPERGYAALDFYTCGKIDPRNAMCYVARAFNAKQIELLTVKRGQEVMCAGHVSYHMQPQAVEKIKR